RPARRRSDCLLDIGDAAEPGRGEAITDVEHPALALGAAPRELVVAGAEGGDHVARARGLLRPEPGTGLAGRAARRCAQIAHPRALAVAHEHPEPIAPIHLVDHRGRELA